jgi:Uma2 family endonuclease
MNLGAALHRLLRGRPCRPLDSNLRVRVTGSASYVYPDISVVCGRPIFDPDDPRQTTIINPRVVIEVLSESTESYDSNAKFNLYRAIESLQEYELVSQQEPLTQTFLRQPDGTWPMTPWHGMESIAILRSLDIAVTLAEVCDGVDFDPSPTRP